MNTHGLESLQYSYVLTVVLDIYLPAKNLYVAQREIRLRVQIHALSKFQFLDYLGSSDWISLHESAASNFSV